MGMFDSFFANVECPRCRAVSMMEFQTKALDKGMKEFRVGDRVVFNDVDINYGYIRNATGECPKCSGHLKGEIRIIDNRFFEINDVKIWEIRTDIDGKTTTRQGE